MILRSMCAAALAAGVFVFSARVRAEENSRAPALTLDAAIRRALEKNVDVALATADVEERKGRLHAAKALLPGNPEIEVSQGRRTDDAGGETTDVSAGVSQEIEIGLQRGSRKDAARAELARVEAILDGQRLRIAADVRAAFLLVLAAREKVRYGEQVEGLGKSLYDAAKRREDAGSGTALETNLAKIEWGDAKRSRIAAQRELAERTAELGRLLSLKPVEMGTPQGELRPPATRSLSLDTFRKKVRERSPSVRASARAKEAARAELTLARKEVIPNLTVRGGWDFEADGAEEIVGVGVSVPIPLFQRNQAGIGAAKAQVRRAEAEQGFLDASLEQEIDVAWQRSQATREELEVFDEDILKQVEENLRLLQSSLSAGKSNLLEVIVVQRRLVDTRRDYLDALVAAGGADAEMERLLGADEGAPR